MGKPKFEQVTPILSVRDVDASIAYYLEKLGFEESWRWGHPTTFGGVSRDNIEILFCRECQGHPGTWMSVWVDDLDPLYDDFRTRGADIRQPRTNFEWGVREMNVADPDGHRLRFSMATDQPSDDAQFPE